MPVSPRLVGTVVFEEEDERAQRSESEGAGIKNIYDPACRTASGADAQGPMPPDVAAQMKRRWAGR